jgi:hypothetical protein
LKSHLTPLTPLPYRADLFSLEKFGEVGEVGEVGEMGEKFILGTEGSGIFSDDHELALPFPTREWRNCSPLSRVGEGLGERLIPTG